LGLGLRPAKFLHHSQMTRGAERETSSSIGCRWSSACTNPSVIINGTTSCTLHALSVSLARILLLSQAPARPIATQRKHPSVSSTRQLECVRMMTGPLHTPSRQSRVRSCSNDGVRSLLISPADVPTSPHHTCVSRQQNGRFSVVGSQLGDPLTCRSHGRWPPIHRGWWRAAALPSRWHTHAVQCCLPGLPPTTSAAASLKSRT